MSTIFAKRVFSAAGGGRLPYRLLSPPSKKKNLRYPLVIFLHGSGERGDDNKAQLRHCARVFAEPANRAAHPCYVVVPQCPKEQSWNQMDWQVHGPLPTTARPAPAMALLLRLIAQLMKRLPIDPARIYVSGISMGGFGTWDLLVRFPERFAAAAPICGGADLRKLNRIARVPIWVFHGDKDAAVKVRHSRAAVARLRKAGSKRVTYSEYAGVGHNCWDRAFAEPKFLPWLFAQRQGS